MDDVMVYKTRTGSELITVGQNPTDDIRYEGTPAGRINSIVIDSAYNVSITQTEWVNVDFLTSVDELVLDDIKIYPNPADKQLTIELGSEVSNTELKIKDVTGKIVFNQQVFNNKTIVPLTNFAKGVYFLEINNRVIKFIKE
jgi:hypothetical protein